MIDLNNIHVVFGGLQEQKISVIKDLNLHVRKGEWVVLVGANGAGKSTLTKIISGESLPSDGQCLIDGHDIANLSVTERAKHVARVFQDPKLGTFSNYTVEENLSLAQKRGEKRHLQWAISKKNKNKFQEAIKVLDNGMEHKLKQKVENLSGGQRQSLSLVMASLNKADVLLLDEHTAALDPKSVKDVMRLTEKIAANHKVTALMITHNMQHAIRYGDRLVLLKDGHIYREWQGDEKRSLKQEYLTDLIAHIHAG